MGEGIQPDHASVMEPFGNAVHATFGTEGGEDLLTNPVAVIGCGPIGLFSVGIARALGAWKVIAIEPNDERRALAAKMGADLLIDPKADDPVEAVLDATDGNGAEVVLEMSGNATRDRPGHADAGPRRAGCRCSGCPTVPSRST